MAFYEVLKTPGRVMIKFNETPETEAEYLTFVEALDGIYEAKTPFRMMVQTNKIKEVPLRWNLHMADWMKRNRGKARLYLTETFIVANSRWVRMFLKALFMVSPPVTRVTVVKSVREAATKLGWRKK